MGSAPYRTGSWLTLQICGVTDGHGQASGYLRNPDKCLGFQCFNEARLRSLTSFIDAIPRPRRDPDGDLTLSLAHPEVREAWLANQRRAASGLGPTK